MANIRGPIPHSPVPGDIARGNERPYRKVHLVIEPPSLPLLFHYYNALPAAFIPIPTRAMGGPPIAPGQKYRGLAPSDSGFFPVIEKRKPWER